MNLLLRIILFIILVVLSFKTLHIIHEKYFSPEGYPSTTAPAKTPTVAPTVDKTVQPVVKPKKVIKPQKRVIHKPKRVHPLIPRGTCR